MTLAIESSVSGPLFDKAHRDKVIRQAVENAVQDLVEQGEQFAKGQLYPGHGLITGRLRRSIHGERRSAFTYLVGTNVIYAPYVENGRSGTRFRGYRFMQKTKTHLDKRTGRTLAKHIRRATARLG